MSAHHHETQAAREGDLPGLSVIVPAHNEERALARCLGAVISQGGAPGLQIIVVANACSDDTVTVARSYVEQAASWGVDLVVIEEPERGKPNALNTGDRWANHDARAYLDADVLLTEGALTAVRRALLVSPLVAPRPRVTRAATWAARSYGAIWEQSPAVANRVIGAGFYAVSARGRARWTTFPPIIADDTFVRLHFRADEHQVLADEEALLSLPTRLGELLAVRGRWSRGRRSARQLVPDGLDQERGLLRAAAVSVLQSPALWRHVPGALLVFAGGSLLGLFHRSAGPDRWETATTSDVRRST